VGILWGETESSGVSLSLFPFSVPREAPVGGAVRGGKTAGVNAALPGDLPLMKPPGGDGVALDLGLSRSQPWPISTRRWCATGRDEP
jgi:hypothetical protein